MAGNQEVVDKTKTCSKCRLSLPLVAFCKNKKSSDSLNYACKSCIKFYNDANKKRNSTQSKNYYEKNKDKVLARQSSYAKSNRDTRVKYELSYRDANRDKLRKYSRSWQKAKCKSDPIHRLKRRISTAMWASLVEGKGKGKSSWQNLVGYTVDELRCHLESKFLVGMSWDNYGKWHIDHIVPLDYYKVNSTEDPNFHKAWRLSNLQPLWAEDNMRKSNKLNWRQG